MMNEFEAKDYIWNKGCECKSIEDIASLIAEVEKKFNYDYGVAPRSIGAVCASLAEYLCGSMGLTGFQASVAMWDFIQLFIYRHNQCGLRMVDYDNMLYPQYEYKFEKTISRETWNNIVKTAKEYLEEYKNKANNASSGVVNHWKSIVDGNVPFGYKIED